MRKVVEAVCVAALMVPLMGASADAQGGAQGLLGRAHAAATASVPATNVAAAGPRAGGGGFRNGGGFRGGGFRGDRFRGGFRGGLFIGPSFGFYDPFWGPFGYYGSPYGYYPPVVIREREYRPPPFDYLVPPDAPPPEQSWYHCANPDGFYPYVRSCDGPWEAVPVSPGRQPPPGR